MRYNPRRAEQNASVKRDLKKKTGVEIPGRQSKDRAERKMSGRSSFQVSSGVGRQRGGKTGYTKRMRKKKGRES